MGALRIKLTEDEYKLLEERAKQSGATVEELSNYLFGIAVTVFLISPTLLGGLSEMVERLAHYEMQFRNQENTPDAAQPASNRTGPLAD